jgi:hypothetical protein
VAAAISPEGGDSFGRRPSDADKSRLYETPLRRRLTYSFDSSDLQRPLAGASDNGGGTHRRLEAYRAAAGANKGKAFSRSPDRFFADYPTPAVSILRSDLTNPTR